MFSMDTLHDIAIRIVEVFTTPMSAFGYGVVVEVVNKRNWVHIVRFVVTDIATLKILLFKEAHFRGRRRDNLELQESLMSSEKSKRKGSSSKLPAHTIRLYDETVRRDIGQWYYVSTNCTIGVGGFFGSMGEHKCRSSFTHALRC